MDLEPEPKPQLPWCTSTCAQECKIDVNLVAMDQIFTLPPVENLVIAGHSFGRCGRGIPSSEVGRAGRSNAWFKEAHTSRGAQEPFFTVLCHVAVNVGVGHENTENVWKL